MSDAKLNSALKLVRMGFHVFILPPNSKAGMSIDLATNDEDQITRWWTENPEYNIGVACHKFGPEGKEELLCVDVDVKPEGNIDGRPLARRLTEKGILSPGTYTQYTPSGGSHIVYIRDASVRPRFGAIGPGIDCLLGRRHFVGAGSTLQGKTYSSNDRAVLHIPQRFVEKFARSVDEPTQKQDPAPEVPVNEARAEKRASEHLEKKMSSPIPKGARNATAHQVAKDLRDFGVSESRAIELLRDWDLKVNTPPLNGELESAVTNAYRYAKGFLGNKAPEKQFPVLVADEPEEKHPFDKVNEQYALVTVQGGVHIIYETKDAKGRHSLQRMSTDDFHTKLAPEKMIIQVENKVKEVAVSRQWLQDKRRREYEGLCFKPGLEAPQGWYNLWRGFSVEPKEGEHHALSMFLEHAKKNVCENDESLFRWLIGYFAHLIQKPYEKPRTGLVFQGKEGVGKNALVDRIGALLNQHYRVTSRRKDVIGDFNAYLENTLLFVLNEVTWGGEKEADGILKNLVDGGAEFPIEKKYVDTYYVENILRPVIIGNEPWLVKASENARRYAVFTVGQSRMQDLEFFDSMRVGMENGGYSHLLNYLLRFDISQIEINRVPNTKGLAKQKHHSLPPFGQWWFDCLHEGTLVGGDFEGKWPENVKTQRFRDAFENYRRSQGIKWRFSYAGLAEVMKDFVSIKHRRVREGDTLPYVYSLPKLQEAREEWDAKLKCKTEWPLIEEP